MATSYLERAKAALKPVEPVTREIHTPYEINERNELSPLADIGSNVVGTHTPPHGCIASRFACPVLGPCDRHVAGRPCLIAPSHEVAA
jgi:hypothetical protein